MPQMPKFIMSDKVCSRNDKQRVMAIKKYKYVLSAQGKRVYTGLIYCYWFDGNIPRIELFHEDDLELAQVK